MKRIISASYKNDIPAFQSEEFFENVRKEHVSIPVARGSMTVSLKPEDVYCYVFWTKNCSDHFLENMRTLRNPFYIQWTITGYGKDIEPNVPDKKTVMERFIRTSALLGKDRVIWRYDPILISDNYPAEYHIQRFEQMAATLEGHTGRCVISFFDEYGKIQDDIRNGLIRKPTDDEIRTMARAIGESARRHGMKIQTCAERGYDLSAYGIKEGPCVDPDLIERLCGEKLPAVLKRTGSFRRCDCAVNTDIGSYRTCRHNCRYCYAK